MKIDLTAPESSELSPGSAKGLQLLQPAVTCIALLLAGCKTATVDRRYTRVRLLGVPLGGLPSHARALRFDCKPGCHVQAGNVATRLLQQ